MGAAAGGRWARARFEARARVRRIQAAHNLVGVEEDVVLLRAELLEVNSAPRRAVPDDAAAPARGLRLDVRVQPVGPLAILLLVVWVGVEGVAQPVDWRANAGHQLEALPVEGTDQVWWRGVERRSTARGWQHHRPVVRSERGLLAGPHLFRVCTSGIRMRGVAAGSMGGSGKRLWRDQARSGEIRRDQAKS